MNNIRILLVEDDVELATVTKLQLISERYDVDVAGDGKTTMELVNNNSYDVILLDVMLPDCTGHELCEQIRKISDATIIFMSCLGDGNNIIGAFREGGDDYLIKPVNPDELRNRITTNLNNKKSKHIGIFKQFIINYDINTVYTNNGGENGDIINLSATEYKLLTAFVSRSDELLLYKDLYRVIWEQGDVEDLRTLMVHISNLRKKIDRLQNDCIRTVRGAGYIFTDC